MVLEHDIRTVSDEPVHVKNPQIHVLYSLEETVNKEVNDLSKMNTIEHSDSTNCSRCLMLMKCYPNLQVIVTFQKLTFQSDIGKLN